MCVCVVVNVKNVIHYEKCLMRLRIVVQMKTKTKQTLRL